MNRLDFTVFVFHFFIIINAITVYAVDSDIIDHIYTNGTDEQLIFKKVLEGESQNVTEIYQKYLLKIKEYCLTKQEFEELFGNKSLYGLVFQFAPYIFYETSTQIGLNELRRYFNLKPQPHNFIDIIEEKPAEKTTTKVSTSFYKNMKYFQEVVGRYGQHLTQFKRDEVDVAETFLDKTFPEIRKMFKLKYREKVAEYNHKILFNKDNIDSMIHTFLVVREDIFDAALKLISRSYIGLENKKGPLNYCNM